MTLKEVIIESKKHDVKMGIDTKILVLVKGHDENVRKSVIVDPDSSSFIDKLAMIGFEDCIVSDLISRYRSDGNYIIIIVDLDEQEGDDK